MHRRWRGSGRVSSNLPHEFTSPCIGWPLACPVQDTDDVNDLRLLVDLVHDAIAVARRDVLPCTGIVSRFTQQGEAAQATQRPDDHRHDSIGRGLRSLVVVGVDGVYVALGRRRDLDSHALAACSSAPSARSNSGGSLPRSFRRATTSSKGALRPARRSARPSSIMAISRIWRSPSTRSASAMSSLRDRPVARAIVSYISRMSAPMRILVFTASVAMATSHTIYRGIIIPGARGRINSSAPSRWLSKLSGCMIPLTLVGNGLDDDATGGYAHGASCDIGERAKGKDRL